MHALMGLKTQWVDEDRKIRFQWDYKDLKLARYIVIIPVKEQDGNLQLDINNKIYYDLRGANNSPTFTQIKTSFGINGVCRKKFFVFASENIGETVDDGLLYHKEFIADVIIGKTKVEYTINEKKNKTAIKQVSISIKSNMQIEQGLLGYDFFCDDTQQPIRLPFSNTINAGNNSFPPIWIPEKSSLRIIPFSVDYNNNFEITEKKNFFGFLGGIK